jgi:hypothetical protein
VGLNTAEDGFRYFLALKGGDEAGCATRAEGEFLHRRKPRDGGGDFRRGKAQPLAILLRRKDWNLENGGPLNQAHGILDDALLLENGGQQTFLHVHNHEAGLGPCEVKRCLLHGENCYAANLGKDGVGCQATPPQQKSAEGLPSFGLAVSLGADWQFPKRGSPLEASDYQAYGQIVVRKHNI